MYSDQINNIVCEHCGIEEEHGVKFKKCSLCVIQLELSTYFCSRTCQIENWRPMHKLFHTYAPTFQVDSHQFVCLTLPVLFDHIFFERGVEDKERTFATNSFQASEPCLWWTGGGLNCSCDP